MPVLGKKLIWEETDTGSNKYRYSTPYGFELYRYANVDEAEITELPFSSV